MSEIPPENRPDWTTFVQWKGTDLCMDLWCPECGHHSHFDGMFAYHVQCSNCEARFEMPTDLSLKKVEKQDDQMTLHVHQEEQRPAEAIPSRVCSVNRSSRQLITPGTASPGYSRLHECDNVHCKGPMDSFTGQICPWTGESL